MDQGLLEGEMRGLEGICALYHNAMLRGALGDGDRYRYQEYIMRLIELQEKNRAYKDNSSGS